MNTRRNLLLSLAVATVCVPALAQKITVRATNRPATEVFADIMRQSGKNFVYSSDLLRGVRVTVDVRRKSLKKTLDKMFDGTGIKYKIKGNNILLIKGKAPRSFKVTTNDPRVVVPDDSINVGILREVVVEGSRNQTLAMNSAHIGALNVSRAAIARTPVLLGESDVIKTLQLEPGISAGVEGMAGMYVHGGNQDENLYMLDNIPLYQVNHFGGLFSAFNTEAISNVDFYKSTFPAKFDNRLSSFLDVYTRDGSFTKYSGSGRLGLTSGGIHVEGPIWKDHTSFSLAVRRSWFDLVSYAACAIINSTVASGDQHGRFGYAFTDVNAKITHRFSPTSKLYAMFYFGQDDMLAKAYTPHPEADSWVENYKGKLRWGNIVASAGWVRDFTPNLFGRITGAYTRYNSSLSNYDEEYTLDEEGNQEGYTYSKVTTRNNIADLIARGDFEWRSSSINSFNFGASFTWHDFLPQRTTRRIIADNVDSRVTDNAPHYHAGEWNFYAEDNITLFDRLKLSAGLHYSLFNITGRTKTALSPRFSFNYTVGDVAVKGGYARTSQFVHQLTQSPMSLPTDQWVPVIGDQHVQTADKVSLGVYWRPGGKWILSAEAFGKWMHHLTDYIDEYYLIDPTQRWDARLCEGSGRARGFDFKIGKEFGKVSGHISYSLLWADRLFANRNFGKRYPAKFDNRHKINVLLDWRISDKWEFAASWTGMSGNRVTIPLQCWEDPGNAPFHYDMMVQTEVNNYRLPFYHRLDLSFTRHTSHGYWTFGLYNAYCNMNVIGVRLDYSDEPATFDPGTGVYESTLKPVFQKIRLIPVIPSVSYTWLF